MFVKFDFVGIVKRILFTAFTNEFFSCSFRFHKNQTVMQFAPPGSRNYVRLQTK